ncbi:MAG: hypothetical protein NNA20_05775 [Nitrospira sp.]|nr:hypothetical protein [Nitrospira sp.]MCP9442083.1 hypothetical protein [Nitrospira sp.]
MKQEVSGRRVEWFALQVSPPDGVTSSFRSIVNRAIDGLKSGGTSFHGERRDSRRRSIREQTGI